MPDLLKSLPFLPSIDDPILDGYIEYDDILWAIHDREYQPPQAATKTSEPVPATTATTSSKRKRTPKKDLETSEVVRHQPNNSQPNAMAVDPPPTDDNMDVEDGEAGAKKRKISTLPPVSRAQSHASSGRDDDHSHEEASTGGSPAPPSALSQQVDGTSGDEDMVDQIDDDDDASRLFDDDADVVKVAPRSVHVRSDTSSIHSSPIAIHREPVRLETPSSPLNIDDSSRSSSPLPTTIASPKAANRNTTAKKAAPLPTRPPSTRVSTPGGVGRPMDIKDLLSKHFQETQSKFFHYRLLRRFKMIPPFQSWR